MSPDGSDRERSPLEPVKDNILLVAGEPPPLELPDPLKGPQAIEDEPEELTVSYTHLTLPTMVQV